MLILQEMDGVIFKSFASFLKCVDDSLTHLVVKMIGEGTSLRWP